MHHSAPLYRRVPHPDRCVSIHGTPDEHRRAPSARATAAQAFLNYARARIGPGRDGPGLRRAKRVRDDIPGADDGNRTRVVSLEDWGSTIELRPHWCHILPYSPGRGHTRYRAAPTFAAHSLRPPHPKARPGWALHGNPLCAVPRRTGTLPPSCQRGVAQLGSASALGAEGRGFKSRHPDTALIGVRDPGPRDSWIRPVF